MTDLTNKLLQLSQAEASNSATFPRQPVELVALTATVLEELVSLAQRKQIDLGMETTLTQSWDMGSETLLSGRVMNLIDNGLGMAIVKEIVQATQGKITLSTAESGSGLVVTVVLPNCAAPGDAD